MNYNRAELDALYQHIGRFVMMNKFQYINDITEETIRAILAKEREEKEQQRIMFQYISSRTKETIRDMKNK